MTKLFFQYTSILESCYELFFYHCMDLPLEEVFHQLPFYALSHKSSKFLHQYMVDAFAVRIADQATKPIKINFALSGL